MGRIKNWGLVPGGIGNWSFLEGRGGGGAMRDSKREGEREEEINRVRFLIPLSFSLSISTRRKLTYGPFSWEMGRVE